MGRLCVHCGNPLLPDDQGVEIDESDPIHRYCFYGYVFGRKAA